MRLLVCGGRDYANAKHVFAVLDEVTRGQAKVWVCTGGARGADKWAEDWARWSGCELTIYPAEWDRYGKSAGPIRNSEMLRDFQPTLVIAFPGGHGTADMVYRARAAGVPVKVVDA